MGFIRYCFVKECFVGVMSFHDDGEISMSWEDDSKLTDVAKRYKKYLHLDDTRMIKLFISERVIDEHRQDRGVWLGMCGVSPYASDLEVFLGIHGVSMNDCFWINTEKSADYWYTNLKND